MEPKPDHGEASYKGSVRLAGRRALITGGDSGMGRAAANAYARKGADIAINYYPDEESDAQEVIKLIKDAGRNAVALPGDLRDEAFCTRLVADAVEKLGGLDILVSNAGRQQAHDSILDISTEPGNPVHRSELTQRGRRPWRKRQLKNANIRVAPAATSKARCAAIRRAPQRAAVAARAERSRAASKR
jgi:hypothetical protein